MSGEKTEEPTEKKLEDAKKRGEGPKSQDVNAAASLVCATILLTMSPILAGDRLRKIFATVFERGFTAGTDETLSIMFDMLTDCTLIALPYLACAIVVGLLASFAQVGVNISFEPIMPNFDKVNPGSGIQKLFSVRSIIDFLKMVLKAVALGAVMYKIVLGLLPMLVGTALQRPAAVIDIGWSAIGKLMGAACIVFIVVGPVDWGIQIWLFKRGQKMSKDEIKRESKESEGDPEMKGKRKEIAHEMANSAPQRAAGASVVVTNPTHYAVALLYQPGRMQLPVVLAKGHDADAARIREVAVRHKVPIVSNPPLARALYKLPLDTPIPEALFEAVAAVLRWVSIIGTMSAELGKKPPSPAEPGRNP